jgi:hypothetical protein
MRFVFACVKKRNIQIFCPIFVYFIKFSFSVVALQIERNFLDLNNITIEARDGQQH